MEENKYYKPEVEEFYLGFEYDEELKEEWSKLIRPPKDLPNKWYSLKLNTSHSFSKIINKIKLEKIRVKYLDKSDIEELGFKCIKDNNGEYMFQKIVSDNLFYEINYDEDNQETMIEVYMKPFNEDSNKYDSFTLFHGYIKNKSELKMILKMVKID